MEKAYYDSILHMVVDITKAGEYKPATCIWYLNDEFPDSVTPCALFLNRFGEVKMDNLPKTGYSYSSIEEDLFKKRLFILRHIPVDYPKAAFWPKEKDILYVDFKEGMNQYKCRIISWENCGYYCIFNVQLEGENNPRQLRVSEYEKSWIFLDPET